MGVRSWLRGRPRLHLAAKIALWLVGGLLALAIVALIAAHTAWGRQLILDQAIAPRIQDKFRGKVLVDRLEGSVLSTPSLKGLVLHDPAGGKVADIHSLSLGYDLRGVLGDTLRLDYIHIEGAWLRLEVRADGSLALADNFIPDPHPKPLFLDIDEITLGGAEIVIERAGEPPITLRDVDATLAGLSIAGDDVAIESIEVDGVETGTGRELRLAGDVALAAGRISADSLVVEIGNSRVALSDVRLRDDLAELQATGSIAIEEPDLRALMPSGGARGGARLELTARREAADSPISLDLEGTLAESATDLHLEWEPGSRKLAGHLSLEMLAARRLWTEAPDVEAAVDIAFDGTFPASGEPSVHIAGTARGRYQDWTLEESELDVTLHADRTVDLDVSAVLPEGAVTARGGLSLADEPIALRQLAVTVEGLNAGAIASKLALEQNLAGVVSASATLDGPIGAMSIEGSLTAERLVADDIRAKRLEATVDLEGVHDDLRGSIEVNARGLVRGKDRYPVARGTARVRRGGRLIELRVTKPLRAAVTIELGEETRIEIEELVTDTPIGPIRIERSEFRAGKTTFKARKLKVKSSFGVLKVDGSLPGGLTVAGQDLDVGKLGEELVEELGEAAREWTGSIDVDARLDGTTDRIHGRARLEFHDLRLHDESPPLEGALEVQRQRDGRLAIDLTIGGDDFGQLTVACVIDSPRDVANTRAWKKVWPGAIRSLDITAQKVSLDGVLELANARQRPGGTVDGTLSFASGGTAPSGKLVLRGARFAPFGTIKGSLRVTPDGSSTRVALALNSARGGRAEVAAIVTPRSPILSAETWQSVDKSLVSLVTVRVRRLSTQVLAELTGLPLAKGGHVGLLAEYRPRDEHLDLEVRGRRLMVAPLVRRVDLVARGVLDRDQVSLSADVSRKGAVLVRARASLGVGIPALIAGDADAVRAAPLTASATAESLRLATALDLFGLEVEKVSGAADLRVTASGALADPALTASFQSGAIRAAAFEFDRVTASGRFDSSGTSLELHMQQPGGGMLIVDSRTGSAKDSLHFSVRSRRFDLGFLRTFDDTGAGPLAKADGYFDSSLTIDGSFADPRPRGWARIQGGRITLRQGLLALSDIVLVLRADGQKLTASLDARAGKGKVESELQAPLRAGRIETFSGTATISDVPIVAGSNIVSASAKANLAGTRRSELWTLDIDLLRSQLRLPESTPGDLHDLDSVPDVEYVDRLSTKKRTGAATIGEPLVRIRVRTRDAVRLRGKEINATLVCNLDITVTEKGTPISGTVEIEQGRVDILGRQYDIQLAQLAFRGQVPSNPDVTVRLSHSFPTLLLRIAVTGSVREPELDLSSEPARYDQAELMSFVLGSDPDSEDDRDWQDRGKGMAASLALKVFNENPLIRFDVLRIEEDRVDRTNIYTVGKWVTDDLFVAYRHNSTLDQTENANEGTIRYRLSRRWSLETNLGDRGQGAADILWVKRY